MSNSWSESTGSDIGVFQIFVFVIVSTDWYPEKGLGASEDLVKLCGVSPDGCVFTRNVRDRDVSRHRLLPSTSDRPFHQSRVRVGSHARTSVGRIL